MASAVDSVGWNHITHAHRDVVNLEVMTQHPLGIEMGDDVLGSIRVSKCCNAVHIHLVMVYSG